MVEVEIRHGGVSASARRRRSRATTSRRRRRSRGSSAVELGDDPWALDEIHGRLPPGEQAARAAVDAALHDLQGKLVGLPVWRLLGLRRDGPPTSWTVWLGDPDDMARRAEAAAARGFRRLKLKLGGARRARPRARPRRRGRSPSCRSRSTSTSSGRSTRRSTILPQMRRSSTASSRCPPATRRARAEAAVAGPDLRRRGLPHARRRRRLRRARARDQDQAREVGRDPRGGADGARGARARARRDARLHGRVGPRDRRRARRSRASATTSTSTGTCCSPHDPWPGVEFADGVQRPSDRPASASPARAAADPR